MPGGGISPRRVITDLKKIIEPVASKNKAEKQINPATEDTLKAQTDFNHGQTDVGTTAVQLTETPTACVKGVLVKAFSTNSGIVYLGKSGVTVDNGYELTAGETVVVEVDNVNKVYVIASAAGQKVSWIGV